ncbi:MULTISPECIES: ABC transporter substrate-binding protein [unclassified Mycolicibacterium]|uniref:ABC transporter substrate-binding protein n=1 Tax=unclassified Mycolicibacterium TaxID=2636767 RepID=UPI0013095D9C|nr:MULTISPECIES: ABC transporter substrate-binding protein [unclassified Mycolicibacterium]MUL84744.1 amino acid ABC transporter substrate-binding protein [Mycolicibacterium sp. CBMA 329]MUL88519.1 amino acid ABC transporter substrate-binding protein [Mycolicibacterium sp. CBMA 331]MUM00142.1 amino acid ABC transporter substrate-binding protein [Mycolicibacterium sp. CBMA 334]MUM27806.1 amino acid ABC transporter substrate-binding protein [Mycolicibacterium sp. CBMA 295]MUM40166.1 amino acid A
MRGNLFTTIAAIAGVTALLGACSAAPPGGSEQSTDELKIGVATAQSGSLAPYDQPSLQGFQMRVDEINAAGGIEGKTKMKLIIKDTRSDAAQASVATQELLQQGVNLLVTVCDADSSIAAGQLAQEAKIPAISFCATSPTLPGSVGDYMFSNYVGDNAQGWAAAKWALETGHKHAMLLKSPDSAYTNGLPQYFGQVFEAGGGKVVGTIDYGLGQQNFDAVVAKIKSTQPTPDIISTAAYEPDFPAFIKALRGAGLQTTVIAADAIDTPTTFGLGGVVDGVLYTTGGFRAPGNDLDKFEQKYRQKYGNDSGTTYTANGYDLGTVIETAVKNSGGDPSGPSLRNAIADIDGLHGVTGTITYKDSGGMSVRSVYIVKIVNGQRELVEELNPTSADIPKP